MFLAEVVSNTKLQTRPIHTTKQVSKPLYKTLTPSCSSQTTRKGASPEVEKTQGKSTIDVAKEFGVQHLIFSSLLSVKNTARSGLVDVPHFDIEAQIEEYIHDSSVRATFFLLSYSVSNLEITIKLGADSVLTEALPLSKDSKLPMIDTKRDTGISRFPGESHTLTANSTYRSSPHRLTTRRPHSSARWLRWRARRRGSCRLMGPMYKGFLLEVVAREMLENRLFVEELEYLGSGVCGAES